jgi:hypothetical protein
LEALIEIFPLVLHEEKHPLLDAVAGEYRKLGYAINIHAKGADGLYGGALASR